MSRWGEFKTRSLKKSPQLSGFLNEGATLENLKNVEEILQFELPELYREMYLSNNGEHQGGAGFFFGLKFMPLEEVLKQIEVPDEDDDEYRLSPSGESKEPEKVKRVFHNRMWLPLMHDWGCNFIGLDFDPDVRGKRGQIINFGRDENIKHVYADSLEEYLEILTNLLDSRKVKVLENGEIEYGDTHFIDALKSD